jgi:uncharacterized coiled-coil protein SlyX
MEINNEHRLTEVEERSKSNQHRIDDLERRADDQEKLISTVAVLASEIKTMKTDIKEIKDDVKIQTNKPAKRWDNLVDKIIITVAAAVIGFILAKIGL